MSMVPGMDPPDDDIDALAGEFVLNLLDAEGLARVDMLRRLDGRFDQAAAFWEQQLMPLAEALAPIAPPARVWAGIDERLAAGASAIRGGLWNSLKFWRLFGAGAGAFGIAGLAAAFVIAVSVRTQIILPVASATLATPASGIFIATAQQVAANTVLIVTPSKVNVPPGRAAELWLILPGSKPAALGLLASDHAVTIELAAGRLGPHIDDATLAISLEPPGGSPTGSPTGPVIAAAKFAAL